MKVQINEKEVNIQLIPLIFYPSKKLFIYLLNFFTCESKSKAAVLFDKSFYFPLFLYLRSASRARKKEIFLKKRILSGWEREKKENLF